MQCNAMECNEWNVTRQIKIALKIELQRRSADKIHQNCDLMRIYATKKCKFTLFIVWRQHHTNI